MNSAAGMVPLIEESWLNALEEEFKKPYFHRLKLFLKKESEEGAIIYPPGKLIFNSFNSTPFYKVKVVIIGQDPYHGEGQAHGLSFSVPKGIPVPPSLRNIYKELLSDLGIEKADHGNLEKWAEQGVLLLNSILTVRANSPASHHKMGWEDFTDAVIKTLNEKCEGLVFILWGNFAQAKGAHIDLSRHLVLKSAHPSPFSAHHFLGCRHFSKTNQYLVSKGKTEIDWSI